MLLLCNHRHAAWTLTALFCFSGCAHWYGELDTPTPISKSKSMLTTPESQMSLQTVFLRLDDADRLQLNELWPDLDEVSFDFRLRRELDLNGIRCGTINGEIPIAMQHWIDRTQTKLEEDPLEKADLVADVSSYSQVIYCKSGTPKDLIVKPMHSGNIVVMHNDGGGKGKTYEDPALMFKLRGEMRDNGAIDLQVEPVIEHGQFRNTVTSQEFALRREVKRDVQQWPNLRIERQLRAGQVLVLSCSDPPRALGEHFFMTTTSDGTKKQLVLLVRIDRPRTDTAFASR